MTNNLSTLEGAQQEVIDQFEANLHAKGVLDAQFDPSTGLLGLIDRIPDIEPSVNINLDIALTLSSSETSINYGESVLLTATLLASYEGVGDVDLKTGEITGATITFKKGQTVIGTSITDNNGVATLTYTPVAADCDTTLTMSAVFSGTDNFNSANSTNVNVTVNSKVELSSNKNILSYADEQTTPGSQVATLTATLYSSTPTGQTVQLCDASDDSVIGNMTDNNDGTYTYSYTSQGSGDIEFYAKTGNLVSETYGIEDCSRWDTCATDNTSNYDFDLITSVSGMSSSQTLSFNTDHYEAVAPTNNASRYLISLLEQDGAKYEISALMTGISSGDYLVENGFGLMDIINKSGEYLLLRLNNSLKRFYRQTDQTTVTTVAEISGSGNLRNTWLKHTLVIDGLDFNYKITSSDGATTIWEYSNSFDSTLSGKMIGIVSAFNSATNKIKNIKVKPL